MKNSISQCNYVLVISKISKNKELSQMQHFFCDSSPMNVLGSSLGGTFFLLFILQGLLYHEVFP